MVLLVVVGYEDPIWPTKEDTDSSYHRVVGVMTEQIKAGKANLMVATHNEATVHFALNRYEKLHAHMNECVHCYAGFTNLVSTKKTAV